MTALLALYVDGVMYMTWRWARVQNGFSNASAYSGVIWSVKILLIVLKKTFICVHGVKIYKISELLYEVCYLQSSYHGGGQDPRRIVAPVKKKNCKLLHMES
jgi:hypothetical protein